MYFGLLCCTADHTFILVRMYICALSDNNLLYSWYGFSGFHTPKPSLVLLSLIVKVLVVP